MTGAVAVLGTGSIGTRHLRVLRDRCRVPVIAVPTRPERYVELQSAGWVCARTIEEAVDHGAVAVVVATDTIRHVGDAVAAIRSGCSVLVEKPLAVDAHAAAEIVSAAATAKTFAAVACCLRFERALIRFREWLGELGALHAVDIECRSFLPDWRPGTDHRRSYSAGRDGGGVLRDLIHEVDYAIWCYGAPERVFGRLGNLGRLGIAAEEIATLQWVTAENVDVCVRLDYLTRPGRRRMRADGERGTLEWDGIAQTVTMWRSDGQKHVEDLSEERDAMYERQAHAFLSRAGFDRLKIDAARIGADPASLDDGRLALEVCDAARESSTTGACIAIGSARGEQV